MILSKERIIEELNLLITKGFEVLKTEWSPANHGIISISIYVNYDVYKGWHTSIINFVASFLPKDNLFFIKLQEADKNHLSYAKGCIELLKSLIEQIEKGLIQINSKDEVVDTLHNLHRIFSRFHSVVRQLRSRHSNRDTLNVADEYDVQDLLHALLRLYFDDIRPEEWTPSYAGGASRMDFLLKNERIVIEVKKTRSSMKDGDLGEQLIVDIEKYQAHPDCVHLICFVYDPEGLLGNPTGIENDLNTKHGGFVEVIIKPS